MFKVFGATPTCEGVSTCKTGFSCASAFAKARDALWVREAGAGFCAILGVDSFRRASISSLA